MGGGIGFSLIIADYFEIKNGAKIGHLNFIRVKKIEMDNSSIKHLNFIKGDFFLITKKNTCIKNQNKISSLNKQPHDVVLLLEEGARIGTKHLLDTFDSITIGQNSILAGADTQVWTHSMFKSRNGNESVLIGKPVFIGRNCYVGARCTILPGVSIKDGIYLGACTCVSKSLEMPGLYVSSKLRFLEFDSDSRISEFHAKERQC